MVALGIAETLVFFVYSYHRAVLLVWNLKFNRKELFFSYSCFSFEAFDLEWPPFELNTHLVRGGDRRIISIFTIRLGAVVEGRERWLFCPHLSLIVCIAETLVFFVYSYHRAVLLRKSRRKSLYELGKWRNLVFSDWVLVWGFRVRGGDRRIISIFTIRLGAVVEGRERWLFCPHLSLIVCIAETLVFFVYSYHRAVLLSQSIEDLQADIAILLHKLIRDEIRSGKNDKEIYKKLEEDFGETVLYTPKFDIQTAAIWLAPLTLTGGAVLIWAFKRYRRKNNVHIMALDLVRGVPLTPKEKASMLELLTPPSTRWWGKWLPR
ncbi:hypothetical protein SASPL_139532 [Salvia splendens]|uniref:Cytochrome c-type biogenesis protein n=1 Tax=Salvia splendens TaxID=180675 RepID=A0A8X8ZAS0_SALSN|nr:hypothetical protein SASPL_139532 [Salvia splendens]